MSTPKWAPGRLYPPGSLVLPRTSSGSSPQHIENADFEQGDTGWGKPAGWRIIENPQAYQGDWFARFDGQGEASLGSFTDHDVVPGQSITLSAYYRAPGEGDGSGGRVILIWMDESKSTIRIDGPTANFHRTGHFNNWRSSSITASAPAGAKYVRPAFSATINNGSFTVDVDSFAWNYAPPVARNLQYKAVQPAAGYSDTAEPAWPGQLGQQVVDHEVIWEAVSVARVVWEARPIMRSGATEPDWPTPEGAHVADGTISWEAISRRVEDENCPNSKVTAIVSSKVFKADRDIVRFSATANPLDWTTERDSGYLPTGLQQANANDMAVLNQYRGNLVAFNASSFQMWQVDPDPQAMAILDQMDGIGSSWQGAAQPVGGELFYLSQQGVRTVGIAAAAENLTAGDVGEPIDELVQASIDAGIKVLSTYYPGAGQYWLAFPDDADDPDTGERATACYVYTMSRAGQAGAWSRYVFPFSVDAFEQLGDALYIRNGDQISIVSERAFTDEVQLPMNDGGPDSEDRAFPGIVWWPWLDFGAPGVTKMMEGFDYVGTGQGPTISVGYDQRQVAALTPPYQIPNDTMPGGMIPMPLSAPTLSVRLDFAGGQRWSVQSVLVQAHPQRGGP